MGAYPPKGLLITGPRGSGKSSLALALARHVIDSGLGNALVAGSTDIISPVLGASEATLAALFQQARSLSPCVLVIDQVHLLTSASAERFGHFNSPFARLTVALGGEFDSLEEPAGPPPDTVDFDKPSTASEAAGVDSEVSDVDCALSRACSAVFVIGVAPESSLVAPSMLRHGRLQTVVALPDMTQRQLFRLLGFYFSQSPLAGELEAIPPTDGATAASPPARPSCVPEGALQSLRRICPCAAAAAERSAADSSVSASEELPPNWQVYLRSLSSHLSVCPSFGSKGSLWTAASTRRLWEAAALGALRRQYADPVAGATTTAARCCITFADVEAALLDTTTVNP
jgi:energy-coupling factor transporter ATP-binding protein EcfA2